MIRMILAHPRSRSHLLGTLFPNYINEPFTPGFIRHSPFFHQNRHLIREEGTSFDSAFCRGYIHWLRDTMSRVSTFTFKVHFCDIKEWPDALQLIDEWLREPVPELDLRQHVSCERLDREMAALSTLMAQHVGWVSYDEREVSELLIITEEQARKAVQMVTTDFDLGMKRYGAHIGQRFTYENMLTDSRAFFSSQENHAEWLANTRFQPQGSLTRSKGLMGNYHEVREWIQKFVQEANQQRLINEHR